jgi:accessory colonization factor AcfC
MKKRIMVMLIVLLTVSLSAFGGAQAEADKGYDLYIYNSKGENAAQFAEMAKAYEAETGVRVRTFSIGSGQDHIESRNEFPQQALHLLYPRSERTHRMVSGWICRRLQYHHRQFVQSTR